MKRSKVEPTSILLRGPAQVAYALKTIPNLPLDPDTPVEILIREQVKKRKLTMNQAMWAGPLRDIERLAWHQGRQFSAEVWHEHLKELFLPDELAPDFDPTHVLDGYRKWDLNPWNENRMLVGSTTQLTDAGMKIYLLQVEAYAAQEYGVEFTTRAEPAGRMVA